MANETEPLISIQALNVDNECDYQVNACDSRRQNLYAIST